MGAAVAKRVRTRQELLGAPGPKVAIAGEAHDAASRQDRALAMWQPPLQSPDQDILPDKDMLDARSRDALRNDAFIQSSQRLRMDSVVGARYGLTCAPAIRALGPAYDETWKSEFQAEVEAKFTVWAESPRCWVDAEETKSFTDLIRLAVCVHFAGGEVLAQAEWLRDAGRPYATAIQMIDTDRLSNPRHTTDSPKLRGGVQRNRRGAPIGYHIRVTHPTEFDRPDHFRWAYVPVRKPWGRQQIIHIREQSRPGQTRGVSAMTGALKEIRQTKQLRSVMLQNAIINASFAATIESELPPSDAFTAIGAGDPSEGVANYANGFLSQVAAYSGNGKNLQFDGAKIPHLYPGTKLNMLKPGEGGPLGTDFEKSLLRYVAAASDLSYEQLSKDYSETNYSSARAALAETWRHLSAQKRIVADTMANHTYRLWLEEALSRGDIDSMPVGFTSDWMYEGLNLDAISGATWIGASRGQIDPLKETQAAQLRLQSNLTTEEYECAQMGMDWREVKQQRAREKAMDDELGLTPVLEAPDTEGDDGDDD